MQTLKTLLFFLTILNPILQTQTIKDEFERNYQTFQINPKDKISINVDNFLPSGQYLNDLHISNTNNLKVRIPKKYNKEIFSDVNNPNLFMQKTRISSFENYITFLYSVNSENFLEIKKINVEDKEFKIDTFFFAPKYFNCDKIVMDEEFVYGTCISTLTNNLQLCKKHYKNDLAAFCEGFSLGLDTRKKYDFSKESTKLEIFSKNKQKMLIFFLNNSSLPDIKNFFYLFDGETHGKLILEEDVKIKKIKIVNYNFLKRNAILLILVSKKDGVNELRLYSILDFKFENDHYKLIKNDVDNFFFHEKSLVFIKEKSSEIEIYDVNMDDLSWEIFKIPKENFTKKIFLYNNFIIFHMIDKTISDDIYILDLTNQRFFKIDDIERKKLNKKVILKKNSEIFDNSEKKISKLQIDADKINKSKLITVLAIVGMKNYFFEFNEGLTSCFELNRFKYVTVRHDDDDLFSKGEIKFKFNEEKYSVSLFYKNFDFMKKLEVKSFEANLDKDQNEFYLDMARNNMIFGKNDPVKFFKEIFIFSNEEQNSKKCSVINSLFKNNKLIKICLENEIWIYKNIFFDEEEEFFGFDKKSVLKVNFDVTKINEILLIFDSKFLVFLTEEMKIYYINLKLGIPFLKESEVLINYSKCIIEKVTFICEDIDKTFGFIQIEYMINDINFIFNRNFDNHLALFDSFIIQSGSKDLLYLAKNPNKENHIYLEKIEKGRVKKYFIEENFQNTSIFEIYQDEYLGIQLNQDGSYNIFSIFSENIINFPPEILKNIDEILDYKIIKGYKIFSILYKTKDQKMRLFVGRNSLYIYQRVIRDIEIGDSRETAKLNADSTLNNMIIFHIYDTYDFDYEKYFSFYLNGPIYVLNSKKGHNMAKITVNNSPLSFSIKNIAQKSSKISVNNFTIRNMDKNTANLELDLEENGNFIIKNGIYSIEMNSLNENNNKFVFHDRINESKSSVILKNAKGIDGRQDLSFKTNGENSDFSLFSEDYLYLGNQTQQNFDYKNCEFVETVAEDKKFEDLFICINRKTNLLEITNLRELNLRLNIFEKNFQQTQLIQIKNFIYVAFMKNGKRGIHFWKFEYNNKDKENMVFSKIINSNEFMLNETPIKYFYIFQKTNKKTLSFFIVNYFDNKFILKELDLETNNFLSKNSKEIFNYQREVIDELKCEFSEKENLICLVKSKKDIYEIKFSNKLNKWDYELTNIFLFPESLMADKTLNFSLTKNYFAIFYSQPKDYNILIFNRSKVSKNASKEIIPQNVFGAIKTPERVLYKNIAFLKKEKNEKITDFLLVCGFSSPLSKRNGFYQYLIVDEFEIGNFKLEINLKELDFKQNLGFLAVLQDGSVEKLKFVVVDNRDVFSFILVVVLIVLVVVLIGLVTAGFMVYKTNKSFFKEREELNDTSSFLDRTQMNI